jgi:hypothetical protein
MWQHQMLMNLPIRQQRQHEPGPMRFFGRVRHAYRSGPISPRAPRVMTESRLETRPGNLAVEERFSDECPCMVLVNCEDCYIGIRYTLATFIQRTPDLRLESLQAARLAADASTSKSACSILPNYQHYAPEARSQSTHRSLTRKLTPWLTKPLTSCAERPWYNPTGPVAAARRRTRRRASSAESESLRPPEAWMRVFASMSG